MVKRNAARHRKRAKKHNAPAKTDKTEIVDFFNKLLESKQIPRGGGREASKARNERLSLLFRDFQAKKPGVADKEISEAIKGLERSIWWKSRLGNRHHETYDALST